MVLLETPWFDAARRKKMQYRWQPAMMIQDVDAVDCTPVNGESQESSSIENCFPQKLYNH